MRVKVVGYHKKGLRITSETLPEHNLLKSFKEKTPKITRFGVSTRGETLEYVEIRILFFAVIGMMYYVTWKSNLV